MVGNDYQRIIDGVEYWRKRETVNALYLLFDHKEDKYGATSQMNVSDLKESFARDKIQPVVVGYNPQSFENVFCVFYGILGREVDRFRRHVLVDVTSTTKEAYGATITIALMFHNVRVYIVPPNERGWYVPSPQDKGFKEWFSKTRSVGGLDPQEIYLPGQRLIQPNGDEVKVLSKLHDHQGFSDTLMSIIKWCRSDPEDPVVKNRFSRIVKRLEDKGFVETSSVSRGKEVRLTHFGKIFSEAIKRSKEYK